MSPAPIAVGTCAVVAVAVEVAAALGVGSWPPMSTIATTPPAIAATSTATAAKVLLERTHGVWPPDVHLAHEPQRIHVLVVAALAQPGSSIHADGLPLRAACRIRSTTRVRPGTRRPRGAPRVPAPTPSCPDRRPADRPAAPGPLLRHPAEPRPAAGRRRRPAGPRRRSTRRIIDRDSPASLPEDVDGLLADHLAVGIDPDRASIFAHSQVEALNGLLVPFLSLVSVAELSRNPTVKDELAAAGLASMPGLMFTYPVHQAADILFCKATLVPVGRDQLPHLEVARLIARRFNRRYSPERPLFPEPGAAARRRARAARHRRPEDEQEPRQRHRPRRHRRRDGAADRGREDRPRARHRLRPVATARGVQPRPARRAVPGARARGGRRGDRGPRQPGAQGAWSPRPSTSGSATSAPAAPS